jgi:hypothetical protein
VQSNVPKINFKSIYNRKVRVDRLVAFNRAARLCASKQSKKIIEKLSFFGSLMAFAIGDWWLSL